MTNLSIIIAVYNSPEWTKHCLEYIHKYTFSKPFVIVIDNNSRNSTHEMLKSMRDNNYIDLLLKNEDNMGSHFAWNQGLNYVESKYVSIIHSDCLVSPNWDSIIIKCLEKDNSMMAASPITNYSDQFYLRYSQTLFNEYVKIKPNNKSSLSYNDISYLIDEYYMFDNNFEKFSEKVFNKFKYSFRFLTEMGTHCVMFKNHALFSLDKFDDEFYPHFGAEKVLLKKMHDRGWDYISCLGSYVHHHGNATSDGPGFNMPIMLENSEKLVIKKLSVI